MAEAILDALAAIHCVLAPILAVTLEKYQHLACNVLETKANINMVKRGISKR